MKKQATARPATPAAKPGIFSSKQTVSYICLAVIILVVAYIRSKFDLIPFERDEGAYSYYGKLLLQGKVPYKDFYEQKFPGIFYFFAMMVGIFGDTVKGMHTGFMLLNILTITFLFFAAKRLFSPMAAVVTATTYGLVSLTPGLSGFTVQGEHGVSFFISLGILAYAYARTGDRWWHVLLMGMAMGAAFMAKTSGMFLVMWGGVVLITDFLLAPGERKWSVLLRRVAIYSAGVFSVIGVLFLLIAIKGTFSEMIFWAYEIPKKYVSKIPWEDGKKYFRYMLQSITADYKFFWLHAMAGVLVLFMRNIPWSLRVMAITLIFFSGMTIVPGFYFYGHYWIQVLPGLSILAAVTFTAVMSLLARFNVRSPRAAFIYAGAFLLITFMHLNRMKSYYFHPNYDRILRSVYGNNPFPESMAIANYINAHANPEDGVVVMGSEPEIYFYTKRNCPSRHAYFAALVDDTPQHKAWQREFIADVEKAKPRFFVFMNHQISLFVQPNTDPYIFEWYNKYVPANYNLVGLVDMVDGYTSNYVWNEQLNNYKVQSPTVLYVYERKS